MKPILFFLLVVSVDAACHMHCQWCKNDVCQECRHNLYLSSGACVETCPDGYVEKRRNWVFGWGRMVGNRCELPLPNNTFLVAWGNMENGGSIESFTKDIVAIFSTEKAFC